MQYATIYFQMIFFTRFCHLPDQSFPFHCYHYISVTGFDKTVCKLTHLHFYAFVKLLAGGGYGLSGAKLKVPQLVLHSAQQEGNRKRH